jgi:hypothetical protein
MNQAGGGLKGTTINKELQIMNEMQKIKERAIKLKKYYEKKKTTLADQRRYLQDDD